MVANKKTTKVICQNCGAEIEIPATGFVATGVVIGENSGLGTIVVPTKDGVKHYVHTSTGAVYEQSSLSQALDVLIKKIEDSGFIDVNGIVRRWIPSQCLNMIYSKNGFHESLKLRGYAYSWKVILNELEKQAKMYAGKDIEGYADRNRWYNAETVYKMAWHYVTLLEIATKKMQVHLHKGRQYIKLRCDLNNGLGVHVDELPALIMKLNQAAAKIKNTKTPKTLYEAAKAFYEMIRKIHWEPKDMSPVFVNAYKAAGAYYTMKDLIMFEGCKVKVNSDGTTKMRKYKYRNPISSKFVEQEESLFELEGKAAEVVNLGVADNGYIMLGFLKEFLEYNKFDYSNTINKWNEQSQIRKAMRVLNRNNRRARK